MVSDLELNSASALRPAQAANPPGNRKKKKKRRAGKVSIPQPQSSPQDAIQLLIPPLDANESISGISASSTTQTTEEQWTQRLQNLRVSLSKSQEENKIIMSDLSAALARASDAEHAEDAVNKGLLTARTVIAKRDRVIAELKTNLSKFKSEVTHLQEEKKRIDKRLVLLKTVSANLQEAREARDAFERRLDEALASAALSVEKNSTMEKEIRTLQESVEALQMVKQELAKREMDFDEQNRILHLQYSESRRSEIRAFGVGALGMLTIGLTLRVVSEKRR